MKRATKLVWIGLVIVLAPRVALAEVMQSADGPAGGRPSAAAACAPDTVWAEGQTDARQAGWDASPPNAPVKMRARWGAPRRFKGIPVLARNAGRFFDCRGGDCRPDPVQKEHIFPVCLRT